MDVPFHAHSRLRSLYTVPGLDEPIGLADLRDFWLIWKLLTVLAPPLLIFARVILFILANNRMPKDILSVWLGVSITFTALFTTSDAAIHLTLSDMVQMPSRSLNKRVYRVVYPSVIVSVVGHICLAAVGLILIPKMYAPFLWIAILLTVAIGLKHISLFRHCAFVDSNDYAPLATYSIEEADSSQESRLAQPQEDVQPLWTLDTASYEQSESQIHEFPNDAPQTSAYQSSLRTQIRAAFSQGFESPQEGSQATILEAKLQQEFGVTTLDSGFFYEHFSWEYVAAFGLSAATVLVIASRTPFLIILWNEVSKSFISGVVCVQLVEITIVIGSHVRVFRKQRPSMLAQRYTRFGYPIWRKMVHLVNWITIASFNIVLFVQVDKDPLRNERPKHPDGFLIIPESPVKHGLAGICMTACMLEIVLGILYAAIEFRWKLPGN